MNRPKRNPPARLPPGYLEAWDALSRLESEGLSRQLLARRLGVSTQTIQRILVSGDVPDFQHVVNTRIRRAWARTLARIAASQDEDPRRWAEAAGIPWDRAIQKSVEHALAGWSREDRTAALPRTRGYPEEPEPRTQAESPAAGVGSPARPLAVVRVGLVAHELFVRPLPGFGESFQRILARRLLGVIQPSARLECTILPENRVVEGLRSSPPGIDLAIGLLDTAQRRLEGLQVTPIPGWRIMLSAFTLAASDQTRKITSWRGALSAAIDGRCTFLVPDDELTRSCLVHQFGIAPDRILLLGATDLTRPDAIHARHAAAGSGTALVLVGLEETLERELAPEEGAPFGRLRRLAAGELAPSYALSIALPASGSLSRAALDLALDAELFGGTRGETARLYAELAAEALRNAAPVRLLHFPQASAEFRELFFREFIRSLWDGPTPGAQIAEEETAEPVTDAAAKLAVFRRWLDRQAPRLLPSLWLPSLRAVLSTLRVPSERPVDSEAEPPPKPPAQSANPFCQSCSVSLNDEHNRGVSDRYCRFCSDAEGKLKPREEVRRILAQWIGHWQGPLPEEEAVRRASLLMEAMPAWSTN